MKTKTKRITKKILTGAFALSLAFPACSYLENAKAFDLTPSPTNGKYNLNDEFVSPHGGVGWSFNDYINEIKNWTGSTKILDKDDPKVYEGLTEENKNFIKTYPRNVDKFDTYFDFLEKKFYLLMPSDKVKTLKHRNYWEISNIIQTHHGNKISTLDQMLIKLIYVDPTDPEYYYRHQYSQGQESYYKFKNELVENTKKEIDKHLAKIQELDKIRLQVENNPELEKDLVIDGGNVYLKGQEKTKGEWKENEHGRWYVYQDGTYPRGETVVIDGVSYTFDIDGYLINNASSSTNTNTNTSTDTNTNTNSNNPNATPSQEGSWQENSYGWWYQNADGSYPANAWKQINGEWYWFDESGYMQVAWQSVAGTWYYFTESGAMAHDTWIDGTYYVASNGAMLTDTTTPDGYVVDSSGVWVQNTGSWQSNSTGWWYQNADGSYPVSQWQQINGSWYYFNESGYMVASMWIGNYYLGDSGAMLTNTTTPDGYVVDENGAWIA